MSQVVTKYCDRCKATEIVGHTKHWSLYFGKVSLSFKDIPSLQNVYELNECCSKCANEIKQAIDKIWDKPEQSQESEG